jgi:hypothetical protein
MIIELFKRQKYKWIDELTLIKTISLKEMSGLNDIYVVNFPKNSRGLISNKKLNS